MTGFRYIRSEDLPEFKRTLDVAADTQQYKLVGVESTLIKGPQYKRICSGFSMQYKLLASDFIDGNLNWDESKGREVLRSMFKEVFPEAASTWMNKIYVYGGPNGYITGRFFKQTREWTVDIAECEVKAEHLPLGSFVIIDTDLNERMLKAAEISQKSPPIPPRREKRLPLDDTLFESSQPEAVYYTENLSREGPANHSGIVWLILYGKGD